MTVGIDIVEVNRFASFNVYKRQTLLRIFSAEEITYALSNTTKYSERFAVRFAAKEAFLKALAQLFPHTIFSFHAIAPLVTLAKNPNNSPFLIINWQKLSLLYPSIKPLASSVSVSHARTLATAIVQLSLV